MIQALKHLLEPWTWKMAWRDTRTSRRRLLVFSLSVVLGVAALVEATVLVQYNAHAGSELRVGELKLPVLGSLHKVPGETVVLATIAPRVYIALDDLERTQLLRQGSLVRYRIYFKFPAKTDVAGGGAESRRPLVQRSA